MNNVIDITEVMHYYACSECGSLDFNIRGDGQVFCSSCNMWMYQLHAIYTPPQDEPH